MIDLAKLDVSLTKHGAHKVYRIMREVGPGDILAHVDDDALGIHIDAAQTSKNLSIGNANKIPSYWRKAEEFGDVGLRSLVLLAICHSHHLLIETLSASKPRLGNGLVVRGHIIDDKAYTNFCDNFLELGFCLSRNDHGFEYDFGTIFELDKFSELVLAMIRDKLAACGLDADATDAQVIDAALSVELNRAIGLTPLEYRSWLAQGLLELEDFHDPLSSDRQLSETDRLQFVAGHIQRSSANRSFCTTSRDISITQLHNLIQNQLYELLVQQYGPDYVGTEQLVGNANRIDVVVKSGSEIRFYEIKTSKVARLAIRQAIPQLLEYAFYPSQNRADVLIIVAPAEPSADDLSYIKNLKEKFKIPIEYFAFEVA